MNSKICTKCLIEKKIEEFGKRSRNKNGLNSRCKKCLNEIAIKKYEKDKEKHLERARLWKEKNKDKVDIYAKKWRSDHKEHIACYNEIYKKENEDKYREYRIKNKEDMKEKAREYRIKNKEKASVTRRKWIKANPGKSLEAMQRWRKNNQERNKYLIRKANKKREQVLKYRLSSRVSNRMRQSLKRGAKNNKSWESLVGYTIVQLMEHLEKFFNSDMSWENYGSHWHVDHKIPISFFEFETPEDENFKICWALNNLQPLEAKKNRQKSNKIDFKTYQEVVGRLEQ